MEKPSCKERLNYYPLYKGNDALYAIVIVVKLYEFLVIYYAGIYSTFIA